MAIPQVPFGTDIEGWVNTTNQISNELGDKSLLNGGFADVVSALNSEVTNVGVLDNLQTTDKTSLVNALNEVKRTAFVLNLILGNSSV